MEFEFVGSVEIPQHEIDEMVERIKSGEPFYSVFVDTMAGHDDFEWEARSLIQDKVEAYINNLL